MIYLVGAEESGSGLPSLVKVPDEKLKVPAAIDSNPVNGLTNEVPMEAMAKPKYRLLFHYHCCCGIPSLLRIIAFLLFI